MNYTVNFKYLFTNAEVFYHAEQTLFFCHKRSYFCTNIPTQQQINNREAEQ